MTTTATPRVVVERMWQTRPGRLAYLISEMLYHHETALAHHDLLEPGARFDLPAPRVSAVDVLRQARALLEEYADAEVHTEAERTMAEVPEWVRAALARQR